MRAGQIRIKIRKRRRLEYRKRASFSPGGRQGCRLLNKLDRFAMSSRQMMKAAFNFEGVRRLYRMSLRVQHSQSVVQQVEPARVAVNDQSACGLALQPGSLQRIARKQKRALEVLAGGNLVTA